MHSVLLLAIALQQTPAGHLVQDLDSPNWEVRSSAMSRFNDLPIADLPPGFAEKAIRLLEREAVGDPAVNPQPGEGYGEYIISLVEGVLRLRDPRSLRGMALVGIQTSREAEEFVASQGGAALPFLDEAWRDEDARPSVGETWGYLLAAPAARLTRSDRLRVIRRILTAYRTDAQAFTSAVEYGELVIATPLVEQVATANESRTVRAVTAPVAAGLRRTRDSLAPGPLLEQLSDALDALCLGASAARAGSCASLADALRMIVARPAAGPLQAFAGRVDAEFAQHVWTDDERRLLADGARYIAARLSTSAR